MAVVALTLLVRRVRRYFQGDSLDRFSRARRALWRASVRARDL